MQTAPCPYLIYSWFYAWRSSGNPIMRMPALVYQLAGSHFIQMDILWSQSGMKLLIDSQTSTMQTLKFGNGK